MDSFNKNIDGVTNDSNVSNEFIVLISFNKKKLTVEVESEHIGTKSLWHSLRILMFGIQIAKHGKIIDWQEANKYSDDIKYNPSWEYLKHQYQPIKNELASEFRVLVPLED